MNDGYAPEEGPRPGAAGERPVYPDIVVSVGTDHHPFDRLITWMDEWVDLNPGLDVLIQRGTSVEARRSRSTQLVPHQELCEFFARAVVVVCHGGPSTVMDARMTGRRPVVVARNPDLGEHVDDHQMRFARHLDRHDLAEVVDTKAALFHAIGNGLADPERMTVEIGHEAVVGIVEFGRVVDQLLSTTTPLMPTPPSDVGAMFGDFAPPQDLVIEQDRDETRTRPQTGAQVLDHRRSSDRIDEEGPTK